MKRVLVLALVALFFGGSVALAGPFGPAKPVMKGGQFSLGPGIHVYSAEWENEGIDVEQVNGFAQAGFGITDNVEIYGQLGAADLNIEGIFDDEDFEDGYLPFGTLGFRALLTDRRPIAMGIFAQGSYFFDTYEDSGLIDGTPAKLEFNSMYELNGGIALHTEIEGALLYFGPFFFVREVDLDVSSATSDSGTVEEDSNFGGFVGIRWPLKNGMNIELEGQYRTKASVGGSIQYVF
ncbi:hypothetical protein DESUT3_40250 [Desulfuromonas versatilis]|uniref:Outer membrane protein beta-barrel domain-containing protein n=1 Tax=Desulfuromonas versatilis TaxID=2802975 RepID=A0ABM8I2C5_9BACT|nr:hypothetical protein [Desulfuromonas versatilis]BCR06956.1 hypothetical protein DESUT3_40250 [Desulfuromonas versatilis]